MKTNGSGGIAPRINLALDGDEWSPSRPGRFNPGEITPSTHRRLGGPQSRCGRYDPVTMRFHECMVLYRSNTGVVVSNPGRGIDIFPLFSVFYVGRGLAMGQSPVQGVLPKCVK
jgi:hypothetical protein